MFSGKLLAFISLLMVATISSYGQQKPNPKTLFYDSDGNTVQNNEFVDIRMANPHYPDRTIVKTLEDGTVEFRLQKIPQEGMEAPSFSVRTIDGQTIDSAQLRGKVVVLGFWFIGCHVCRAIKPDLNKLKARFGDRDDIVFLAMTMDPKDEVEKYLKKEPFDYIQATDAKAAMSRFVFNGFPKNIVIDRNGKIVYWRTIIRAWDKFESVVRGELAKPGSSEDARQGR